jgi:2-amino-4-hydroxy-6-hydroxymethyldihydropteridine diphosphokinase
MSGGREVHVGLGSNLGDRLRNLAGAIDSFTRHPDLAGHVEVVRVSLAYETDPVGPPGQGPYLNAVVALETTLAPRALLAALLAIELERGRDRARERRNGPRTLDLDLLCWGGAIPGGDRIDEPGLQVPHPRMHERSFVLVPLAEVAPALAASAQAGGIHS